MDSGLRLWIAKTAKRNLWRVARWHELDDLICYGYLCYARTRIRYPDLIKPPLVYGQKARFVSMFKRIYSNELHDLSNSRRRSVDEIGLADVHRSTSAAADEMAIEALLGEQPEEGTLAVLKAQAPLVVRNFLEALETEEGLRMLRGNLRKTSRHRETLNERLCMIAGCDPKAIDLEWEIRDALTA